MVVLRLWVKIFLGKSKIHVRYIDDVVQRQNPRYLLGGRYQGFLNVVDDFYDVLYFLKRK
jgi:hypothetical protein